MQKERAVSWATWLKTEFPGHLFNPQPPSFFGFQSSELGNEPPEPLYQWSLGGAGGQPGPRTVGANDWSAGLPWAKTVIFSKLVPRPLGMFKQVLLGPFQSVVARYGPRRIPKCLANVPFWNQKWVKNG